MIVDLHAHLAMHVIPQDHVEALEVMTRAEAADRRRDAARARFVDWLSRKHNYPRGGTPGVRLDLMSTDGVGLICAPLYLPLDEIDLPLWHGTPPRDAYFDDLEDQLEAVVAHVDGHPGARMVDSRADLDDCVAGRCVGVVPCVEGGFHLGENVQGVRDHVGLLAGKGVGYITVAHLFDRRVATNMPALPFMKDWMYRLVFFQAPWRGLSERGRAMVEEMVSTRVLIDVTHMSEKSMRDTFALLDKLDPGRTVPPIASHMACRFGRMGLKYNLRDPWIKRIAERGGVMGVILCEHLASDGVRNSPTRTVDEAVAVVLAHVERIRKVTGSMDHAALGSDLDGWIKPTLHGLDALDALGPLRDALVDRYGTADAEKVCSGNALRVLREHRFAA